MGVAPIFLLEADRCEGILRTLSLTQFSNSHSTSHMSWAQRSRISGRERKNSKVHTIEATITAIASCLRPWLPEQDEALFPGQLFTRSRNSFRLCSQNSVPFGWEKMWDKYRGWLGLKTPTNYGGHLGIPYADDSGRGCLHYSGMERGKRKAGNRSIFQRREYLGEICTDNNHRTTWKRSRNSKLIGISPPSNTDCIGRYPKSRTVSWSSAQINLSRSPKPREGNTTQRPASSPSYQARGNYNNNNDRIRTDCNSRSVVCNPPPTTTTALTAHRRETRRLESLQFHVMAFASREFILPILRRGFPTSATSPEFWQKHDIVYRAFPGGKNEACAATCFCDSMICLSFSR